MRKLLTLLPLLFLSLALPHEAEAKRFGGGKSVGKQYSVPQKPQAPTSAGQPTGDKAAAAGAPRASGASRWLGPLAGLAAGGLLAALFFGDAFEGLQIMDVLVLAALLVGGIMLFRALRARHGAALQPAGGPPLQTLDDGGPAVGARTASDPSTPPGDAPDWFDAAAFVEGAKVHFLRLQAAWDKGDMRDIAEYTTPELFAHIQAQRLSRGEAQQYTEVLFLEAALAHVQREDTQVVASVRFTGLIREERDAPSHEFAEVWHVTHAWESAAGDWFIAGIQQV